MPAQVRHGFVLHPMDPLLSMQAGFKRHSAVLTPLCAPAPGVPGSNCDPLCPRKQGMCYGATNEHPSFTQVGRGDQSVVGGDDNG